MSLSALRSVVSAAASDTAEVNAVIRELTKRGHVKPYDLTEHRGEDRKIVRVYLWRDTPLGDLALMTGPSIKGQLFEVEEVPAGEEVTAADVDLYVPAKGRRPAFAAYKRSRRNGSAARTAQQMVAATSYGTGYSPSGEMLPGQQYARTNAGRGPDRQPRLFKVTVSPDFDQQLRTRYADHAGEVAEPPPLSTAMVAPGRGAAVGGSPRFERAPVFAWLYDAAGRRYRVAYRVLATAVNGSGPVLASNLPGSFTDTPDYPPAFQARSLGRLGERQKIDRIAREMDPARMLMPHADPTFGAPVVWEGNGEAGTRPGRFYVLGGNSRTIAFLMAPADKIREYDAAAAELWGDIWPAEPPPAGTRWLVVRQAYAPDCPTLQDALALNAACQMPFAQAQGLAGATQQSMAGRETPLGEAVSLVRGLGITGDLAAMIPSFKWSGAVARDTIPAFLDSPDNRAFLDAISGRIGRERYQGFVADPDNAAKLVNSVLIGFLPRAIIERGFGSEREERALLGALPTMATVRMWAKQREIPEGFDLLPHLEDARQFADAISGMSMQKARAYVEQMYAQQSLALRTAGGDEVRALGDRIGPLGVLLGLAFKRAEGQRDPTIGIDDVLKPYAAAAWEAGQKFDIGKQAGLFGGGSAAPKMPADYPAQVLGAIVARAIGGPDAEPIVPRTKAGERGDAARDIVSVGSGGGGGLFGGGAAAAPAGPRGPAVAAKILNVLLDAAEGRSTPGYEDIEAVAADLRPFGFDADGALDLAYKAGEALRDEFRSASAPPAEGVIRAEIAKVVPDSGMGGASAPAPALAPAPRGPQPLPQRVVEGLIFLINLSRKTGYRDLAGRNDEPTRKTTREEIAALADALDKARAMVGPDGLTEPNQRLMNDGEAALRKMRERLAAADARQALVDETSAEYARVIRDYRAALGETRSEDGARSLESQYGKVLFDLFNRLRRDRASLHERLRGESVDPLPTLDDAHRVAQGEVVNLTDDEIRRRFSAPPPPPPVVAPMVEAWDEAAWGEKQRGYMQRLLREVGKGRPPYETAALVDAVQTAVRKYIVGRLSAMDPVRSGGMSDAVKLAKKGPDKLNNALRVGSNSVGQLGEPGDATYQISVGPFYLTDDLLRDAEEAVQRELRAAVPSYRPFVVVRRAGDAFPPPPVVAPVPSGGSLADELRRQAAARKAAAGGGSVGSSSAPVAPAAPAETVLAPPPPDEDPLPGYLSEMSERDRAEVLALYREGRALDRDAAAVSAKLARHVYGSLDDARRTWKVVRDGYGSRLGSKTVAEAADRLRKARRDLIDDAEFFQNDPFDGPRPRPFYESNRDKAAYLDAMDAAEEQAQKAMPGSHRELTADELRHLGSILARYVKQGLDAYVTFWPDGAPQGGARAMVALRQRDSMNGRIYADLTVTPVVAPAEAGMPRFIDLRVDKFITEGLRHRLDEGVTHLLAAGGFGLDRRKDRAERVVAQVTVADGSAPVVAPAPTIDDLQSTTRLTVYPGGDGRYVSQVTNKGGVAGSSAQTGLDNFDRLLGALAPGGSLARGGARNDYVVVNDGADFRVMTADDARAFLGAREAEWLARSASKWNEQADRDARWQRIGREKVPGIRLQDALSVGRMWEAVEAGTVSRVEWDRYLADLRAEGKIRDPDPDPPTSRAPVPAPAPAPSAADKVAAMLREKMGLTRTNGARGYGGGYGGSYGGGYGYAPAYRRNGARLGGEEQGVIREILADSYGRGQADQDGVLALLLDAVAQLPDGIDTAQLASNILDLLDGILQVYDAEKVVPLRPAGAVAAAPAPAPEIRVFYRPALNKQNSLLGYVDPKLNPLIDWDIVKGEVRKTLRLDPSGWDQMARSLMTDRPGEFVGGVVGDVRRGGHLILTEIKADGRPTFYVDSQGYDYARYVLFDADVPMEQVRDRIQRTMTADLKTLIADVGAVRDEQYRQALQRGYTIPRWYFPQDAAERELLARVEDRGEGSEGRYEVTLGRGSRNGPPSYTFEFDLLHGDRGMRYYKTLAGALKQANAYLAEDTKRIARLGSPYVMTAADVKPYIQQGDRVTPEQRSAWHAAHEAAWNERHQRAGRPVPAAPAPMGLPPEPPPPGPRVLPSAAPARAPAPVEPPPLAAAPAPVEPPPLAAPTRAAAAAPPLDADVWAEVERAITDVVRGLR